MKNLSKPAVLLLVVALVFGFASCDNGSSDDNASGGGSNAAGKFVSVTGATVSEAVEGSKVFVAGSTVKIPSMYVCDHEVAQGEYEKYCKYGSTKPVDTYGKGENYPAYWVSWFDALVYCNLRSIAEGLTPAYKIGSETTPSKWAGIVSDNGKYCGPSDWDTTWDGVTCDFTANGYRLPTEAEWEYIARGGNNGIPETQTTYSGSDTIGDVAWYKDNSESKTHEVKGKAANTLGIYDISGNVWEWCWDRYAGPSSDNYCVYRGGSCSYSASYCAVSNQNYVNPNRRYGNLGFRIVRSAQ